MSPQHDLRDILTSKLENGHLEFPEAPAPVLPVPVGLLSAVYGRELPRPPAVQRDLYASDVTPPSRVGVALQLVSLRSKGERQVED